ncbi:MAG: PilZ domain-containing protein [Planctomycetota bacterium]
MSEPQRPKDRRLHPRFAVVGPIELGGKQGPGVLRDISMSGLSCTSPVAFEEMTVLEITMKLPHPNGAVPFKAGGAVVRCEAIANGQHSVAVFFTQMDAANSRVLAEFIQRQAH